MFISDLFNLMDTFDCSSNCRLTLKCQRSLHSTLCLYEEMLSLCYWCNFLTNHHDYYNIFI